MSEALAGLASAMRRLGARWCLLGAQATVIPSAARRCATASRIGKMDSGRLRPALADRSQLHLHDAVLRAPDEGLDLDELIEAQHLE